MPPRLPTSARRQFTIVQALKTPIPPTTPTSAAHPLGSPWRTNNPYATLTPILPVTPKTNPATPSRSRHDIFPPIPRIPKAFATTPKTASFQDNAIPPVPLIPKAYAAESTIPPVPLIPKAYAGESTIPPLPRIPKAFAGEIERLGKSKLSLAEKRQSRMQWIPGQLHPTWGIQDAIAAEKTGGLKTDGKKTAGLKTGGLDAHGKLPALPKADVPMPSVPKTAGLKTPGPKIGGMKTGGLKTGGGPMLTSIPRTPHTPKTINGYLETIPTPSQSTFRRSGGNKTPIVCEPRRSKKARCPETHHWQRHNLGQKRHLQCWGPKHQGEFDGSLNVYEMICKDCGGKACSGCAHALNCPGQQLRWGPSEHKWV